MLESHPAIVCQTEVFNSDNPDLPYPLTTPTREILERWVYRALPAGVACAGFVLQAYHPWGLRAFPGIRENPLWADVWPLLQGTPELRVIHLRRENLLRRHLSHRLARESGEWHDWDPVRVSAVSHLEQPAPRRPARRARRTVTLEPDRLRQDFIECEQLHQRVARRFRGAAYHALTYEELCADPDRVGGELLRFLGVAAAPLQPAVSKLEDRALTTSIENFTELRQAFADTRWRAFFEPDPLIPRLQ